VLFRNPLSWRSALAFSFAAGLALGAAPAAAAPSEVTLQINGLQDLGPGWSYEGWIIQGGQPKSTGTFTVDASGALSRTSFSVQDVDPARAQAFVLTIEPAPDADPGPSQVHVLGGNLSQGSAARLSVGHSAALGNNFTSVGGSFILAAPSGPEGTPHREGIWWLDPGAGPGPSLKLPSLPGGWIYEGWVVGPEGPVSTGRFSMPPRPASLWPNRSRNLRVGRRSARAPGVPHRRHRELRPPRIQKSRSAPVGARAAARVYAAAASASRPSRRNRSARVAWYG
jgi:hypothetical protein